MKELFRNIHSGSPRYVVPLHRMALPLAAMVILCSAVVILGWMVGSPVLKSVVPGMKTMKVNAAISLALLAMAVIGLRGRSLAWRRVGWGSLALVSMLATATLSEYAFGIDLRIDNLMFTDLQSPRFPGRSAPATNLAFLGLAVGLALIGRGRFIHAAQAIFLIVALTPLAALGGYLYQTPGMYRNAPYSTVALNTAVGLMLLCISGLCMRAEAGLMGVFTSDSLAGSMARKLLPAAVGLPLMTGLLVLVGHESGLYTAAFGSALLVTFCALFFGVAVTWTVTLLWKTEQVRGFAEMERGRALMQLGESESKLRVSLESACEARREAESANRAKDEFLSVVSHELRTPLTAIMGWAQLLHPRSTPEDLAMGLATIQRNSRGQLQIIDEILDMGRMSSGKVRLNVSTLDWAILIDETINGLTPTARAKGVTLIRGLASLGGKVRGDADRLQQVVWNLLSNAIKFTPRDGYVRVKLDEVNGHAVLEVIDTGAGIAPTFLPQLFKRFRQEDSSTTRRFGGLGLGLSIARNLVELHGGTISAQSDGEGKGAMFRVVLPLAAGAKGAIAVEPTKLFGAVNLKGLRVLVVDDEPDARELTQRILQQAEAMTTVAGSADEALTLVRGSGGVPLKGFDVIVSDIGMPGRDGCDLIEDLRKLPRERGGLVPAIALTAYTRADQRTRAMQAGFDVHLTKPVDPHELCAMVARVSGRLVAGAA